MVPMNQQVSGRNASKTVVFLLFIVRLPFIIFQLLSHAVDCLLNPTGTKGTHRFLFRSVRRLSQSGVRDMIMILAWVHQKIIP